MMEAGILREYHKTTGRNDQSIKTGDVVLIHDDVPKTKWKMAVVEQLIRVIDGYVRAATIRYNGGRTISKLYPLEVPSVETVEVSSIEAVDQNTIDDDHDKDRMLLIKCLTSQLGALLLRPNKT